MAHKSDFQVRFWGVRGSYAAPGQDTVRYGGNTSCVEVRAGGKIMTFDAGTGIIPFGKHLLETTTNGTSLHVAVFVSHHHFDHIQGFPFFRPAFSPKHRVYLYGPSFMNETVRQTFDRLMVSPMCPFDFRQMAGIALTTEISNDTKVVWGAKDDAPRFVPRAEKTSEGDVVVEPFVSTTIHPRDGVSLYRVSFGGRRVVYGTDVEGIHDEVIEFAKDADLLIFDAMYKLTEYESETMPTKGWGHSTAGMARDLAKRANVKRLALFHHNPDHDDATLDDKEKYIQKDMPTAFSAKEGQVVEI